MSKNVLLLLESFFFVLSIVYFLLKIPSIFLKQKLKIHIPSSYVINKQSRMLKNEKFTRNFSILRNLFADFYWYNAEKEEEKKKFDFYKLVQLWKERRNLFDEIKKKSEDILEESCTHNFLEGWRENDKVFHGISLISKWHLIWVIIGNYEHSTEASSARGKERHLYSKVVWKKFTFSQLCCWIYGPEWWFMSREVMNYKF